MILVVWTSTKRSKKNSGSKQRILKKIIQIFHRKQHFISLIFLEEHLFAFSLLILDAAQFGKKQHQRC